MKKYKRVNVSFMNLCEYTSYRKPIYCTNLIKSARKVDLSENITVDENGQVHSDGLINFFDEKHVSALLCNYSKLKEDSWESLSSDIHWMMIDFDNLTDNALKDKYPLYYDLMVYK